MRKSNAGQRAIMRQTQSEATDGENEQQDCGSNGFLSRLTLTTILLNYKIR